jgi:uncharacterized protein
LITEFGEIGAKKPMEFFLCVIGMVMVIEGLPYFAFPNKMKSWVGKIIVSPDSSLRRFGLVLMVLGLSLVYLGRT